MATCATSFPSPKIPNLAFPVSTSLRPNKLAWRLSFTNLKSFSTMLLNSSKLKLPVLAALSCFPIILCLYHKYKGLAETWKIF